LKYTVEKIEDAIKSGQYRDTVNIGAQDEKENKKHNKKTNKTSNTYPIKNRR